MIEVDALPTSEINTPVFRIIVSRYPQISLFERVANQHQWDILYAVESLTNPRLRDEIGDIRLVPLEDRVFGDGASWIMAAFTHPPTDGRGGRFNRDFGVYYCSPQESVCVAESSFHQARFFRDSNIAKISQEMRVIHANLGPVMLHDVRHLSEHAIYDRNDYRESQKLGDALRDTRSHGVQYRSVRTKGLCFGVMRARALSSAVHRRYLRYHYENGSITQVEPLGEGL